MNARSAESSEPMFEVAERMILAPSGLSENRLSTVLDAVMSRGVDYADLYFQLSREESWSLEDGIVKEGSHSIEQGVGVRAISGEKTGFAYTDEVLLPALIEASDAARAIARSGGRNAVKAWQRPLTHRLYLPVDPLDAIRDEDKVAWLMRIDADTRRIDPRVKQVMASLAAVHEVILIATSDGTLTADVRPLVRVNVSVIVEQNGRREQGYSGGGGRFGLDELLRGDTPFEHGREAVRQALVNLDAVIVASRQPRIGHQLGCFQPTRPDEHAALHQLAVGEPEALLGRGGDRRVGADLDPQVSKDFGGLADQLR